MAPTMNLRAKQTESLIRMLNLNERVTASSQKAGIPSKDVYKVLILDSFTRDVISPLIRLNELRRQGVTLYLMIDSDRQTVADVPAIYFCKPTSEILKRIVQDLAIGTYDVAHLNFCLPLSSEYMQELASGLMKDNCIGRLSKLYDQYLAFVSLEADLFSLMLPRSYVTLNDPNSKDSDIEKTINSIVEGLYCVLATLGIVPVIRCQTGGVAEHVGRSLEAYLRQQLAQRNNPFSDVRGTSSSFHRPLLVLFDRNFDLTPQIQHAWTYHGMVHDVLGMNLGRVSVSSSEPGAPSTTKKSYDVGPDDFFWHENGSKPFPKVAEEVEIQLNKYKQDMAAINEQTAGSNIDEDEQLQANTKNLMNAVSSLPELTERKRIIDKHTNIATALLSEIKDRQIDSLCSVEEELLGGKADKSTVLKTITSAKSSISDKLRLVLIWLLSCEVLPTTGELEEVEQVLKGAGTDVQALSYVRRLRNLRLTGSQRSFSVTPAANTHTQGNILDFADKLYSQGLNAVTKGMKTLMGAGRTFAITRTVQALMEGKGSQEASSYAFLDPKMPKGTNPGERKNAPYRDAIVCVVGAGNYLEYHSLQEMSQRMQTKCNIIYGATDLLMPNDFLQQLTELGSKAN